MATGDVSPADRQAPGHPRGLHSSPGPAPAWRSEQRRRKSFKVFLCCWVLLDHFFICYEAEERGKKKHTK